MENKYFKKIYPDRTAFGKWKTGDAVNYNEPDDGRYTIEFITEQEYIDGVKNMPEIPKTKEQVIEAKKTALAEAACIADGDLDSKGELK